MDTYDYFDHDADIGIIGRGESLEAAFVNAAEAMFAVMGEMACKNDMQRVEIAFEETDSELALVQWLNNLLAEAQSRQLHFIRFTLAQSGVSWRGTAWGCPLETLEARGTEVKGATLTMLSVSQTGAGWEARCVIDV